jgi:V8-like Glu-specific endopeptidase
MPYSPRVVIETVPAMENAFNLNELAQLLGRHQDMKLTAVASLRDPDGKVFTDVLDWLNRRDQLAQFVAAARAERPLNVDLMKAEQLMAMTASARVIPNNATSIATGTNLQDLVQALPQQIGIASFLDRVARAEPCVCRIEIPIRSADNRPQVAYGTGFLIANDRVLTNWHVARNIKDHDVAPDKVRLRFGYKKDAQDVEINSGRVYGLAANWLLASSPFAPGDERPQGRPANPDELDYALLAVAGSPGADSALQNPVLEKSSRGHVNLKAAQPVPAKDLSLFVLGHPDREPMAISMGRVLYLADNGVRVRHDAYTLGGSSGSPVFDANFQLVALHHAGDPEQGPAQFNQAVPIMLIANDIAAQVGD